MTQITSLALGKAKPHTHFNMITEDFTLILCLHILFKKKLLWCIQKQYTVKNLHVNVLP